MSLIKFPVKDKYPTLQVEELDPVTDGPIYLELVQEYGYDLKEHFTSQEWDVIVRFLNETVELVERFKSITS